jgi:hypothetical protein
MSELMSKFNSGELIGLVTVGGGLLVALCGIVLGFFSQWQKTRRVEMLSALKQDMLNRGMSGDDIRTVLESGSKSLQKVPNS